VIGHMAMQAWHPCCSQAGAACPLMDVAAPLLAGWTYLRMDGNTSAAERGDLVRQFNHPGRQQPRAACCLRGMSAVGPAPAATTPTVMSLYRDPPPCITLGSACPAPAMCRRHSVTRSATPPPADSDAFLFLLSVRAGGVGLNLQAADTVIM